MPVMFIATDEAGGWKIKIFFVSCILLLFMAREKMVKHKNRIAESN